MKTLPRLLVLLAVAVAACAHQVPPGHVWTLRGTVSGFSDTELSVRHKSGQIVTMRIDGSTVFTSDEGPAGRDALAKAARVAVDVEVLPGGGQRAKVVRIVWGGA